MTETKKGKQLFTVSRLFFLLIVIPLLLMAFLIANGIFQLGDTSKKGAISALDEKFQQELLARAISVSDSVADFLRQVEKDTLVATILPVHEETYIDFVEKNNQGLWVKKDGTIAKVMKPLYTEMAYIDSEGNEIVKIVDGHAVPKAELTNVSDPAATTYKSEDYFEKAKKLNKAQVYMSHVMGWYVDKTAFENGERFTGIIRLATPLFDKQGFAGVVTLALDVQHLAKFTDNIIPTESGYVLEADVSTGNYAYMVDNRGFIISHPVDSHVTGLYPDGTPVPPVTEKTISEMSKKGEEVLNLNLLGPIDPELPVVTKDAAKGNSGVKSYKFSGHTKIVAYSPINYYSTSYPEPAGFGWVGLGIDVDKFNEVAMKTSEKIEKETRAWTTTVVLIIIISIILLFFIASILARGVGRSIEAEIPEDALEPPGYDDED